MRRCARKQQPAGNTSRALINNLYGHLYGQNGDEKMIKNENYYTVFGWMINDLHLSGNNLTTFAVIYSFSQDGKSTFKGSLSYLMEFTGASLATVKRCLFQLEKEGLIYKNSKNRQCGGTDGYCVSQTIFDRVAQNELPGGGGWLKMSYPVAQNELPPAQNELPPLPPHYIINTAISTGYIKKERKKEKEIYKEKETARMEFEKMSDEDLLRWGEGSCDLCDPLQEAIFYAWCNECRKRKETTKKWKGKVIKNDRVFGILKSHEEVMDEMGVSDELKDVLKQFLRNSYLNKHLIPNDKLIDIICRLNEYYEDDEAGKIRSVNKAIAGGWYDICELKR